MDSHQPYGPPLEVTSREEDVSPMTTDSSPLGARVVFPRPPRHTPTDDPIALPVSPAKQTSINKSGKPRISPKRKQKILLNIDTPGLAPVYTARQQSTTELLGEQSYLLSTLPTQHRLLADYMRRLSDIQSKLQSGEVPSDSRRKTKKQLSNIQRKITEVSEQQKIIHSRLGEIFVEIQNRQHWMHLLSPRMPFGDLHYVGSPITPLTPWTANFSTPGDMTPIMSPSLDATTAEFIPMGPLGYPMPAQPFSQDGNPGIGPLYDPGVPSPCSERWEDEDTMVSQPSKSDLEGVDYSVKDHAGECLEDEPLRSPFDRRLSVPCLKSPWPSNEMADPFEKYVGAFSREPQAEEEESEGEEVEIILDGRGR